jgi:type I restriction enzyme S subunit
VLAELKPYPEYKDSGQRWIGPVPAQWRLGRIATVARLRSQKGRTDLPLLSVFLNRGVIPYGQGGGQVHKPSLDLTNYQVVRPGDLVLNNQQAWRGSVGVSRHLGIISPAYVVMELPMDSDAGYCDFLFQSRPMVAQLVTSSKGVGDIQRDIHLPWLKNMVVALPPPAEQAGIVRFLGAVDRKVNRFIRAKRRLIEVLTEQKQAIITHAVTKGLNPSARMKPSGLPWVGEVPDTWELVPNRALFRLRKQVVGSRSGEHTLLSLTKRGVIPRDLDNPEGKFPASFDTYQVVEPGDFIFCLFDVDETPRAVGLSDRHGMITGAYTRFRCLRPEYREFLFNYYVATDDAKSLKPLYTGLRKVIPKGVFLSTKTPLPPQEEAARIVGWIRDAVQGIDKTSERIISEIDLIREYRTRLVADVVTGKVDVRGVTIPDDPHAGDTGNDAGADAGGLDGPGGDEAEGDADDAAGDEEGNA